MKQPASLLFIVLVLTSSIANAQTDFTTMKTMGIPRVEGVPEIDGVLDEALWDQAVLIDDFHQVRPAEYAPPSQKTEFLLAYGDDALYIAARLFETDPNLIGAKVLRQGEGLRVDDRIRIILDPFNDKRSGYVFQTNPNSVRFDGIYKGQQNDFNWDGIWQGASEITDQGWTTEVAIPFKTLSFNADADWGIDLVREIIRNNEQLGWSSRNRAIDPSVGATLKGIHGVSQGMGLDVVPAVSLTNKNNRTTNVSENSVDPSLDIYYKFTPALNAALTFNTDFSATEVDSRQVDLSRFNTFFPEKRSFFLRESDIFEFGGIGSEDNSSTLSEADRENGRPYFSRRIGLSASGEPVGLDAGAKLTGRVGNLNIGAMGVLQEEFEGIDSTNIFVGRVSANVLEESAVGVIATQGDPRSRLDNSLIGVDYRYKNSRLPGGQRLDANFWYQQSDTEGVSGDDAAFGILLTMPNASGWRAGLTAKEIQQNFNPALGFVSRSGVRQFSSDLGYTKRYSNSYINSAFAGIDVQRVNVVGGGLQSENVLFRLLELENDRGDELEIRHNKQRESLIESFEISTGVVIPENDYRYADTEIILTTAHSRPANVELSYLEGNFYTGHIRSMGAEIDWRPSKHFYSNLAYEIDQVELPEGKFDTKVISASLNTVFSNTLSWVNLVQYDNVSNSLGVDSRLHWTPETGKNLYLVLNQGFDKDQIDDRYHSTDTDMTLKVDYTFRF